MRSLDSLGSRVEVRVAAIYDEDALLQEIAEEHSDLATAGAVVEMTSADDSEPERARLARLATALIETKRADDNATIMAVLEPLAVAVSGRELDERMVLNAAFLVERERVAEFRSALDLLERRYGDRMRLALTGPSAPHSFDES
jgi:hypothetical protein